MSETVNYCTKASVLIHPPPSVPLFVDLSENCRLAVKLYFVVEIVFHNLVTYQLVFPQSLVRPLINRINLEGMCTGEIGSGGDNRPKFLLDDNGQKALFCS